METKSREVFGADGESLDFILVKSPLLGKPFTVLGQTFEPGERISLNPTWAAKLVTSKHLAPVDTAAFAQAIGDWHASKIAHPASQS